MPTRFRTPFDPNMHRDSVKRARGTACYGALAAHFGTDSPKLLELRVDDREPYDSDGDKSISNKYLRWRQGKALPHVDSSIPHALARSGGAVRLDFWRDLPLWNLLALEPPTIPWIHRLLEGRGRSVRKILFLDGEPERYGFNHSTPDREQLLAIRNLRSLDAFVALLALARKGEQLEDAPQHFLPSACAFDTLPYVLRSHGPLRYRWEGLFACLERIFWNRVYVNGSYYVFPIERVHDGLHRLQLDPAARLPVKSGRRQRERPYEDEDSDHQ